jgi:putative transposase
MYSFCTSSLLESSSRVAPSYSILRSDKGPEFISHRILRWLTEVKIDTALIDPGKPWQNGADGSFNGKFRDECLNMEWFRNRVEARVLIEIWRWHYNAVRPHSSLQYHHESTHQGASSSSKWPEIPQAGQWRSVRPQ